MYEAIQDNAPLLQAFAKKGTKAREYSSEPYPLTPQKKTESAEKKEKEQMEKGKRIMADLMLAMNKKFGNKD